jgi:hypothetical protein
MPVALFALILMTILITGVLLTSTTELVLSHAQRDATQDLYTADGAIDAYVAQLNQQLQPTPAAGVTWPSSDPVARVYVAQEAFFQTTTGPTEQNRLTYYSVRAEPLNGGRSVVSYIRVRQATLPDIDLSEVNAALTLGGDARVGKNSKRTYKISDGTATACDQPPADHAVLWADGVDVEFPPSTADGMFQGTRTTDPEGRDRDQLISDILGGLTIRDLAWGADIRFGSYFGESSWSTSTVSSRNSDPRYNWGCPGALETRSGFACAGADYDAGQVRSVAIDAENGNVVMNNYHGQGILIVVNGTLVISGDFTFRGLIIAERNVRIIGSGSSAPTIEGAVISAGQVLVDGEASPGPGGSFAEGAASIYFNRCALNLAQSVFNDPGTGVRWGEPAVTGRTHNWFELVR